MTETIHLPYLEPWDWQQFHRHFALRLLPGVERLDLRGYARTLRLGDARGWLSVSAADDRPALELTSATRCGTPANRWWPRCARCSTWMPTRRRSRRISPATRHSARWSRHNPACVCRRRTTCSEQAVRAVVGQQVTVKAAVTITRRLVERLGEPLAQAPIGLEVLFPTARAIADDPLENIGMPAKRAQALRRLAGAVAEGALHLHVEDGADTLVRRLCELPGIGPWTAEYIALRGFGVADAFPVPIWVCSRRRFGERMA